MSVVEQLGVADMERGLAEARELWQDWVAQDRRLAVGEVAPAGGGIGVRRSCEPGLGVLQVGEAPVCGPECVVEPCPSLA